MHNEIEKLRVFDYHWRLNWGLKSFSISPFIERRCELFFDNKKSAQYLIKDIVNRFNAKGITTRLGKKMSYNIVQYMLTNRKYIGEFRYNDIVIPDAVPAIISKDLFERVQHRMAQNKHAPARHKAEDDYLLTTKLFCGKCGALMVGEAGTGRKKEVHRYYKCVNAKKHTCDKKTVRKLWIEDLAVQKAMDILHDEVVIDYLIDRIFDLQGEENPRLPRLRLQLENVENRIKNIITAIEQGIIFDSTKDRLAELEKEKSQLDLTIIQEQIKKPFLTKEQIRFGIEKFKKLDISTKEGKQRLIDGFINAIYLYDDKITFTFNYKDGTKTVFLSELNCTPSGSDLKCLGAPKRRGTNRCLFFLVMIRSSTGIEGWRRLREQTSWLGRLKIRLLVSQLGQLIIVHWGAPLKAQFLSTAPKSGIYAK